ncbi:phosphoribosylglycinamide formyltransferase [Bauldia litoralis]|uniref:Phosphoribosylglycinamide formyltransferase n=1 Tax=Bauldia litoralis TaxID=665467 RepID=A0A1G6DLF4_9HYPH|nr:phosphoribosylglycinamide formyltransferase [Bauldia litoralis]SDB45941.1 phosphoribosylglycinamide formyltransferase-1 [Bauldia litoralis]
MARRRTAILISGRGTNMTALIAASMEPDYPAEISLVLSNRPEAPGLKRASDMGLATDVVDHKAFDTKPDFEAALTARLEAAGTDLICLAGFMRLVSEEFVDRWHDRLINIHPSLLPAFTGLNTHARALDAGVKLHGCTVHYVRAAMDNGPIIAQAAVPVLPGDTADALGERVLAAEHQLYPRALALVAREEVRVVDELVRFSEAPSEPPGMLMSLGD